MMFLWMLPKFSFEFFKNNGKVNVQFFISYGLNSKHILPFDLLFILIDIIFILCYLLSFSVNTVIVSDTSSFIFKHFWIIDSFWKMKSSYAGIEESLIKFMNFCPGCPPTGTFPKSIMSSSILTFGIMMLALRGTLIFFPPLTITLKEESMMLIL